MTKKIVFQIIGMHCQSCVVNIESALRKEKGVISASVNLATQKAYLEIEQDEASVKKIEKAIEKVGYKAIEETDQSAYKSQKEKEKVQKTQKKRFVFTLIFGLPIFYLAMAEMLSLPIFALSQKQDVFIQFILTIFVIGASFNIWKSGVRAIVKLKPNMDSLIFLGTFAAFICSIFIGLFLFLNKPIKSPIYFESAALILVFISLGKYLEAITKGKTNQAIKKLIGLQAKETIVLKENQEVKTPIDQVQVGDITLVKPGEKIPVDGIVVWGSSFVDEAMITGEPIPKEKTIGNEVIGGTINKNSVLKFQAKRVGQETMLANIIKMVEAAMGSKAPIQALADKVSFYFVPAVFGVAVLSFIIWLLLGFSFSFALMVFVAVLVIACPCVLGLATPTVIMMATGIGALRGVLIKSGRALEIAKKVEVVVFDKTGTLTVGKPIVSDILPIGQTQKESILKIAGSLEKNSEHPLGLAIVKKAQEIEIEFLPVENFEALGGKGIKGIVDDNGNMLKVFLGNRRLMEENNIEIDKTNDSFVENLENQGKTIIFLGVNQKLVGILAISDILKEHSKQAVLSLQKMGKKVAMITGDNQRAARAIAKELSIDYVLANVLPQDKANEIKKIQQNGKVVAMVGDGINDAPALAQADLGVALGSGTDVAMETGDIILVKNDLRDVVFAIALSKYTFSKIKQNLFWAFFYNLAGIPLAAGVFYFLTGWLLSPVIAALAMAFSSVSIILNSLLMKKYKYDIIKK